MLWAGVHPSKRYQICREALGQSRQSTFIIRRVESPYVAGENYTIADIAIYPWIFAAKTFLKDALKESFANKPALARWLALVESRPAVQRGMQIPLT